MPDMIDHPPHYQSNKYECIDVIEDLALNFNLGNVFKYLWRLDKKDNNLVNLRKARWYLDREISRREGSHLSSDSAT